MEYQLFNHEFDPICVDRYHDALEKYGAENHTLVSETSGTPYPFNLEDGRYLQDHLATPDHFPHPITFREAARNLEELHCVETGRQRAALNRLRRLETLNDRDKWGPDVIYKTFHDMDDALFGGKLRGHVSLFWDKNDPQDATLAAVSGPGPQYRQPGGGRVRICMCADMLLLNPHRCLLDTVECLGHEMIVSLPVLATLELSVGQLLENHKLITSDLYRLACLDAALYS